MKEKRFTHEESLCLTYIRVISTLFIFLCHVVGYSENKIISLSGNIFDVGVYIFFMLSGFLYSSSNVSEKYSFAEWMRTKYIRITLPVMMFMCFIVILNGLWGYEVSVLQIMAHVLNLEIVFPNLHGMGHLWFLSVIMICYAILYLFDKTKYLLVHCKIWVGIVASLNIAAFLVVRLEDHHYIVYLINIFTFLTGYIMGRKREFFIKVPIFIYVIVGCLAVGVRLTGYALFYGTMIYHIIAAYTHFFLACTIFMSFFKMGEVFSGIEKTGVQKVVNFFDEISYEIYIVHYFLVKGVFSIIGAISNLMCDIMIAFICTVVLAFVLHKGCKRFEGRFLRR